ncbi:MAG: putative cardiolipin synthase [Akkermansiaceae bacterium]|jgi:putative cardiolipin synthase
MIWLLLIVALTAILSFAGFHSWHRFARAAQGERGYALPVDGPSVTQHTILDRVFADLVSDNLGKSGLMGLFDNADAFAARAYTAQKAGRSLDVMTYIWRTDKTGWLLMRDVLDAADRGVRVRLLLDDIYVQSFDPVFLSLSFHPNIEVRLFNPLRNRGPVIWRALETMLGLRRYNRRLHSKAWIADGRFGIVGGRNIGDTYFLKSGDPKIGQSAARISRDADLMLAGPAVREIETFFDGYWNLGLALPIRTLLPKLKVSLKRFRRHVARKTTSPNAKAFLTTVMDENTASKALIGRLRWTSSVRVLADPPEKAYGSRKTPWIAEQVHELIAAAQSDVSLITPYFVPDSAGLTELAALARRGKNVSLLTNALSASDNIFVHGAYRHYRVPLLASGAKIFEFSPSLEPGQKRDVIHSKVLIFDGKRAIVGSQNFDMRSTHTNVELGILFEEPELIAEIMAIFDKDTSPALAYSLSLQGKSVQWDVKREGMPRTMTAEPEATLPLRAISWAVGHLPFHSWL